MKIIPSIHLTRGESVWFEMQHEPFMADWRSKNNRLHQEFPDDDILTIAEDEHGRPEVVFIQRGEISMQSKK